MNHGSFCPVQDKLSIRSEEAETYRAQRCGSRRSPLERQNVHERMAELKQPPKRLRLRHRFAIGLKPNDELPCSHLTAMASKESETFYLLTSCILPTDPKGKRPAPGPTDNFLLRKDHGTCGRASAFVDIEPIHRRLRYP